MSEPVKLTLRDLSAECQADMLEMLDRYTEQVKAGEITRIGIVSTKAALGERNFLATMMRALMRP